MIDNKHFDVIIIGGSYAGLAAGMALGRSLKQTLIIDSGKPCNRQTPHSHNFLTQDGKTPTEIAALAKQQVEQYKTIKFFNDVAVTGTKTSKGFEIGTQSGEQFSADKLIFATGIKDLIPNIEGLAACWGISVLHCPYCHGYEVKNERTGILANGEFAFEYTQFISNWTQDLTLYTNGPSTLTSAQAAKLQTHQIKIVETPIDKLEHDKGHLKNVILNDGTRHSLKALYAPSPFEQHCTVPNTLGCELTEEGYIKIDPFQKTTVQGIFACGDSTTRMRTVANAIAMGATAGMMANKEIVLERF